MSRVDLHTIAVGPRRWSGGLGHVRAASERGDRVAVACDFRTPYWPGRAQYDGHVLRHRVVIYERASRAVVGVLDDLRFPVHEIAWRPDGGAVALACGEYDGGYAFEGELVLWDLSSGAVSRPMQEDRCLVRVRWTSSDCGVVLARPPTDEDGDLDALFAGTFGAPAGIDAVPCVPAAAGFDGPRARVDRTWLDLDPPQPPSQVWDIAFVEGRIVAATETGLVAYDLDLNETDAWLHGARCVQLLRAGTRTLVHVLLDNGRGGELRALEARETTLLRRFERPCLLSMDARGRILARDAASGQDLLLDASGRALWTGRLGHFDCFNHALRVDDGPTLLFLRGTPPSSHQQKWVCTVDEQGVVTPLFTWDDGPAHRMDPSAAWVGPTELVAGYRLHHPHPGKGERRVEHRAFPSGVVTWSVRWPHAPIAIAPLGDAVLVATQDGRVAALDRRTGALRGEIRLAANGPLAPLCLAVDGELVVVGTNDGRVASLRATPA